MRFCLRTLLIVATIAPLAIGGPIAVYNAIDRWVKGEYRKVFEKVNDEEATKKAKANEEIADAEPPS